MRENNIYGSSYINKPEMIRILEECNLLQDFQGKSTDDFSEKSAEQKKSHTPRSVEVID